MKTSAADFAEFPKYQDPEHPNAFPVGCSHQSMARGLRKLADEIEEGLHSPQSVRITQQLAYNDFLMTQIEVRIGESVKRSA